MLGITNVTKVFDGGTVNETLALFDINLFIEENDFITVIGGNGAGKSTLLNSIAGLFPITAGRIELDGIDISKQPEFSRAQHIGRVFQDPKMGTASKMTIEENLSMALRRGKKRGLSLGLTSGEKDLFFEHLKTLDLGLENRMKIKAGLLSGGQRQALTLLMATIKKPKLLLLDEHTAALDPRTAETVLYTTNKIISENNLTALMITHNMKDALKYGNRIIMMHEGKIILNIDAEKKKNLKVEDLLHMFEKASGDGVVSDRMFLN